MNFLSLVVSATIGLNSLGHIPTKIPPYLGHLNSPILKQLPSFLKTASSFILRPVNPTQLVDRVFPETKCKSSNLSNINN